MGRCWTGYTSISGGMPGMTHSYRTHGLLATAWGHLFSHSYGLFEAQMPSEKIRWIRSLRGAECELENLHPCFFISADDEASFLVKAQSLAIELTNILRLALKVGIMAVEPVHTPMRLEVCLFQDAPDAGATEGLQPMLRECCDQVVQTPPGGGTMRRGRFPGRHCEHIHALRGGKRAAGAPSAG